ncbi:hypothetical protein KSS87_006563, partial [Heliosperma pusillum]
MFVEENARKVPTSYGRESYVLEIVLVDHSSKQPLIVSAWNDLAGSECDKLGSLPEPFNIIRFTALRISTHKGTPLDAGFQSCNVSNPIGFRQLFCTGFSLTTTMSTTIDCAPGGPKAGWSAQGHSIRAEVRNLHERVEVMTIAALKAKKARNTLQDERHTLRVRVPFADLGKVNAYLGCSNCGRRSSFAAGETFKCEICKKSEVIAVPRVTFNCEVSDGTGKLDITAFTSDTELLFRMAAPDIFHMKHSVNSHIPFTLSY